MGNKGNKGNGGIRVLSRNGFSQITLIKKSSKISSTAFLLTIIYEITPTSYL